MISAPMRLDLEARVDCADGPFGEMVDAILNARTQRLTHLVVEPDDAHDPARLIPAADAGPQGEGGGITIRLTAAEISRLEPVHRFAYVRLGETPLQDPGWDVGIQDISPLPGPESLGPEAFGAGITTASYDQHVAVSFHRIPDGTVEIRRASAVASTDGSHLGHVVGFVIQEDQELLTHLILEHGHLWGKRQVAIPAGVIERLENDAVTVSLTSDQVGELESLPHHH